MEFGEEMLWIFDEQMRGGISQIDRVGRYLRLLLDGLRSALVQHSLRVQQQETESLFRSAETSSYLSRVAHLCFITFACVCGIFSTFLFLKMVISNL